MCYHISLSIYLSLSLYIYIYIYVYIIVLRGTKGAPSKRVGASVNTRV